MKSEKKCVSSLILLILLITACSNENNIERTDYPTQIIAEDARLTNVSGDYEFDTAGAPLYMGGDLYFTNNNFASPEYSRTLKQSSSGRIDTLSMGNGHVTTLQASGKGTIYACEMLGHRVVELETDGNVLRVVADEYNGNRIDGPNDLVVDQKGGLYFSDSQFIGEREKMQETPAVYYVTPQNEIIRVIDDIEFPNGMALTPDGSTLYIANTQGSHVLAYDVNDDGTVENRRNFAAVKLAEGRNETGADGMAIDLEGNVYLATTQGLGVQVFNSKGEHLGNISGPEAVNNVNFGGEDGKTIYMTGGNGVFSIQGKVAGFSN